MFQLRDGKILEEFPAIEDVEPLASLWRNFARTVAGEGEFIVSGRDGRAALQLALDISAVAARPDGMLERFIRQQIEKKTFPGVSILAAAGDRVRLRALLRPARHLARPRAPGQRHALRPGFPDQAPGHRFPGRLLHRKKTMAPGGRGAPLPAAAGAAGHPGAAADPQRRLAALAPVLPLPPPGRPGPGRGAGRRGGAGNAGRSTPTSAISC